MIDEKFYSEFDRILRQLYTNYINISKIWIENNNPKINLKKTTLFDYSTNPDSYKDIKK